MGDLSKTKGVLKSKSRNREILLKHRSKPSHVIAVEEFKTRKMARLSTEVDELIKDYPYTVTARHIR